VPRAVQRRPCGRAPGGILTYAPEQIRAEVAYVAYHFHWALEDILDLEHLERRSYIEEIGRLNTARDGSG
jgi:hypothetical protein